MTTTQTLRRTLEDIHVEATTDGERWKVVATSRIEEGPYDTKQEAELAARYAREEVDEVWEDYRNSLLTLPRDDKPWT